MTEMSESHAARGPEMRRKLPESQGGSPLARPVHMSTRTPVAYLLALSALLAGCILPPSLSSDGEGSKKANSPPAITAVRTDADNVFEPGPVSLTRNSGTINFELLDTDVDDTLQVRVFIGYR